MLNLAKQKLSLSLSADSEVLSLNLSSVFADNKKSHPCECEDLGRTILSSRDSRAYGSRITGKKIGSRMTVKCESGRSMIEMLGVLAIIGVLSVGGIAGYSKAMMQYKINKTVDQISHIVGNVRTLFGSQKNYGSISDKNIWKKAHLVPDEMWNKERTSVENIFGGELSLDFTFGKHYGTTDNYRKAFGLHLTSIPEEACMALATYDWGSGSSSGLLGISINYGTVGEPYLDKNGYSQGGYTEGVKAFAVPNGSSVSVPMPVNIAALACQSGDNNSINLMFY